MNEPTPVDQAMILGELRGQMREVIHAMNNLSSKVDSLGREVVEHSTLAVKVGELDVAVRLLMEEHNRRGGAEGMLASILKSPALGWLVGAAITAWAILTGKVHV